MCPVLYLFLISVRDDCVKYHVISFQSRAFVQQVGVIYRGEMQQGTTDALSGSGTEHAQNRTTHERICRVSSPPIG